MLSEILYKASRIVILSYARLMLKMGVAWRSSLAAGAVLFSVNHPSATASILIHLISRKPMSVIINS